MPDYIYDVYNALLNAGWRMKDIDEMDMLGYLRLRAWAARREQRARSPRRAYIDEVWGSMRSM